MLAYFLPRHRKACTTGPTAPCPVLKLSCESIVLQSYLLMNIYDACTNANVSCNSLCMCMVVFQCPTPIPEILSLELWYNCGILYWLWQWMTATCGGWWMLNMILYNSKYKGTNLFKYIYNYKFSHIYIPYVSSIKPRILHDYNGILITWSRSGVPHCGARLVECEACRDKIQQSYRTWQRIVVRYVFSFFAALEDVIWLAESYV